MKPYSLRLLLYYDKKNIKYNKFIHRSKLSMFIKCMKGIMCII